MDRQGSATKAFLSSAAAAVAPLVYGACLASTGVFEDTIKRECGNASATVMKNMLLLIFGGAFVSNILCSATRIEKLQIIRLSSLLFAAGFLIHFGRGRPFWYAGRFVIGLASGAFSNAVPCYLNAIAPADYRGLISSLFTIGLLSGLVFGNALNLLIATPAYLLGLLIAVCIFHSLALVFCMRPVPQNTANEAAAPSFLSFLCNRKSHRSLFIIALFHFAQHFSGINHVLFSAQSIFSEQNPAVMLIILCSFALLVTVSASSVIDRVSRKLMTLISSILVSGACVAFYYAFLPEVFSFVYILGFNLGLSSIPYVLIGEIFPAECIGHGALFASSCNWLGAFSSILVPNGGAEKHNSAFLVYVGFICFFSLSVLAVYNDTRQKKPRFQ